MNLKYVMLNNYFDQRISSRPLLLITCVLLMLACKEESTGQAQELRVSEGFKNPIGFYDASPTFSWRLPASDKLKNQSSYQIVVASDPELLPENPDLWDSQQQKSDQSNWIAYEGEPLESRDKVFWQIKYWDQDNQPSQWSEVNSFELGLLENGDWKGQWIGLNTAKDSLRGTKDVIIHTPQYLRKTFNVPDNISEARLYVTSKGVFNGYINGASVSNDVMAPGWTPYQKRIETITYEVTELVKSDANVMAFELASGWYSGRIGWSKSRLIERGSPKLICQLEILLEDGSKEMIVSDESWKATTAGPIRFSEVYDGEVYDANLEMPDWQTTDFNDNNWPNVLTEEVTNDVKLRPKRHHKVRPQQKVESKSVTINENRTIFDLKQNIVGVASIKAPMLKGDTLKIRFSEMLQPDGSFYTDNYRSAKSTDYFIASQDGIMEWAPEFTFHGFQFVELSGYNLDAKPSKDWVTGLVQYSDFDKAGSFKSSHSKLNRLQSNIVWGLRGNFFDIPTDCPQRDERLGWTGDAQVFAPTSMFNADVHSFWVSWLQSVRESQFENGAIPIVVPDVLQDGRVSSGWGDAAVIIPWDIYRLTGDVSVLEENYETMKKWVQYHQLISEDYISQMDGFGDWLQPYQSEEADRRGDTSKELIGTAYFAHTANIVGKTAAVLGHQDDQSTYEKLFTEVSQAFQNEFFDENAKIKNGEETQTAYLLALGFELLNESRNKKALENLIRKIDDAEGHLRTGFLGTPLLPKVLDKYGEIELMASILFKETYPSWFFSINQGATTMWERWNSYDKETGFNSERMNSLNHYAYGAIGQWMYERLAGIAALEPGYKVIRIAPIPVKQLNSASASYDSPYGKIKSSWNIEDSKFHLETTIPPNTTAKIFIPGNTTSELTVDGKSIGDNKNVNLIATTDEHFELLVSAG
ncbi:MAG: family 78 glycoside hydrolase catalytic domain, partial [Pricia sp.]